MKFCARLIIARIKPTVCYCFCPRLKRFIIDQVDEFGAGVDVEFLVDGFDMGLYGVFGNEEFFGNGGHGVTLGQQKKDFTFATREAVLVSQLLALGGKHFFGGGRGRFGRDLHAGLLRCFTCRSIGSFGVLVFSLE